jgi:PPK2 family polyphosphate:nucleotide phosphotransferase
MKTRDLRRFAGRFQVPANGLFRLKDADPDSTRWVKGRDEARAELESIHGRLARLQEILYAEARHAVLVVLQAMDTGGKDSTIRHVFGPLNPQGVQVTSFKAPVPEELAHDYLWRIHREVPARGMIRIFNRSHYEDVLVVRVRRLVPRKETERRYEQINEFERYLSRNGVTIVKIFLHISRDEQKRRLQARLDDPEKRWKFSPADIEERKLWDEYMDAVQRALRRCSTPWAPWYVVPANRKWYRDVVVGRIVLAALRGLKLRFPPAPPGLDRVVIPD